MTDSGFHVVSSEAELLLMEDEKTQLPKEIYAVQVKGRPPMGRLKTYTFCFLRKKAADDKAKLFQGWSDKAPAAERTITRWKATLTWEQMTDA